VIVAVTGASGAVYGIKALELLGTAEGVETHLVMSPSARTTLSEETDYSPEHLEAMADVTHRWRDIGATIASGSFRTAGMIIAPCSIKTLSAVASCHTADLIARAADVTLKERRPLVLMVRETPFHHGHLRLMSQVTEMGGIVFPPVPGFYHRPTTIDDLVTQSTARALDLLRLGPSFAAPWGGPQAS